MANTKFIHIAPTYEERIDFEIIELINLAEFDGRKKYTIKEICQESVFSFVKHEQHIKLRITRMKRDGVIKIVEGNLTLAPKPLPAAARPKLAPAKSKAPKKAKVSSSEKPKAVDGMPVFNKAATKEPESKPNQETNEEPVMDSKTGEKAINPDLIAAAKQLRDKVKAGEHPCPQISRIDEKIYAANYVADLSEEPLRTIMIELADDLKVIQNAA